LVQYKDNPADRQFIHAPTTFFDLRNAKRKKNGPGTSGAAENRFVKAFGL
jgi:hypothetical protein